jgi:hypothetical protein
MRVLRCKAAEVIGQNEGNAAAEEVRRILEEHEANRVGTHGAFVE